MLGGIWRPSMMVPLLMWSTVTSTNRTLTGGLHRSQVKTLTYGFIYGGGDLKLGSILHPEFSDHEKKSLC